jgi:segregation and condensation protein B
MTKEEMEANTKKEQELNKELNLNLNENLNKEIKEKKITEAKEEKQKKDFFSELKKIEELRQLVEAILFMSPQPIPLSEIAKICETSNLELISELIQALKEDLIERKSGLQIVRETEGYRMQVLPELEVKVSHLAGPSRFSKGVMKTLAYIAFKQPVKQSTVIKYRTNKAYDEIKILEKQGFISREKAGITYVIKTTKKFLQYFGDNAIKLTKNPQFK